MPIKDDHYQVTAQVSEMDWAKRHTARIKTIKDVLANNIEGASQTVINSFEKELAVRTKHLNEIKANLQKALDNINKS